MDYRLIFADSQENATALQWEDSPVQRTSLVKHWTLGEYWTLTDAKRTLANSMDLNLYPRHFEPLFREIFRKVAFLSSVKHRILTGVFVTAAGHIFQAYVPLCCHGQS